MPKRLFVKSQPKKLDRYLKINYDERVESLKNRFNKFLEAMKIESKKKYTDEVGSIYAQTAVEPNLSGLYSKETARPQMKGLVLMGPTGTGKTFTMYYILNDISNELMLRVSKDFEEVVKNFNYGDGFYALEREYDKYNLRIRAIFNRDIVWVKLVDFALRVKEETIQKNISENQALKKYLDADFLFLDDLGSENNSEWTRMLLYKIIDYRYSNNKTTFVTTNFTTKEIKDIYSDRVLSRLQAMCRVVMLKGEDKRVTK